jgi:hypothetical protein
VGSRACSWRKRPLGSHRLQEIRAHQGLESSLCRSSIQPIRYLRDQNPRLQAGILLLAGRSGWEGRARLRAQTKRDKIALFESPDLPVIWQVWKPALRHTGKDVRHRH